MPRQFRFLYSFLAIAAILIYCASNIKWGKESWKTIIAFDAYGYYAYLPAAFLYKDLNFRFIDDIETKYQQGKVSSQYEFRQQLGNVTLNKYYCGTALAQLPFFGAAHLLSGWFGQDQDGYSKLYMVFISLGAIFYLLLGLFYLRRILLPLKLPEWQLTVLLVATVFGTHIFYYTIVEPGMSHIYSFAFITLFVYYSRRFFLSPQSKYFLILALLLGIITLIRPVNILTLFLIFFTAGSLHNLQRGFKYLFYRLPVLLTGILLFSVIISLQFIIYRISTGNWWVYSYGEEGFNFLKPHFLDILFSYRKGLFLYTPLFLISLTGCYFLWLKSHYQFISLISFLTLLIFVLSSWWNWWYGGSFSGRPFLEFSSIFIFLLAFSLKGIKSIALKKSYLIVIIFLVLVCQFQTYQYRKGYIHWENMTGDQYWNVFLNPGKLLK